MCHSMVDGLVRHDDAPAAAGWLRCARLCTSLAAGHAPSGRYHALLRRLREGRRARRELQQQSEQLHHLPCKRPCKHSTSAFRLFQGCTDDVRLQLTLQHTTSRKRAADAACCAAVCCCAPVPCKAQAVSATASFYAHAGSQTHTHEGRVSAARHAAPVLYALSTNTPTCASFVLRRHHSRVRARLCRT